MRNALSLCQELLFLPLHFRNVFCDLNFYPLYTFARLDSDDGFAQSLVFEYDLPFPFGILPFLEADGGLSEGLYFAVTNLHQFGDEANVLLPHWVIGFVIAHVRFFEKEALSLSIVLVTFGLFLELARESCFSEMVKSCLKGEYSADC